MNIFSRRARLGNAWAVNVRLRIAFRHDMSYHIITSVKIENAKYVVLFAMRLQNNIKWLTRRIKKTENVIEKLF